MEDAQWEWVGKPAYNNIKRGKGKHDVIHKTGST